MTRYNFSLGLKTRKCVSCGRYFMLGGLFFCPKCLARIPRSTSSDASTWSGKLNERFSGGYPDSDHDGIPDPYDRNPYGWGWGGADGNPNTPW